MADYTQDQIGALADLKEAGQELILIRDETYTFDPVRGKVQVTELPQSLFGILKSPKTFRGNTGYDQILEEAARLGRAKVFLCAALTYDTAGAVTPLVLTPQPADRLEIHGVFFKVHGVTILEPGGVPILYTLTLLQE